MTSVGSEKKTRIRFCETIVFEDRDFSHDDVTMTQSVRHNEVKWRNRRWHSLMSLRRNSCLATSISDSTNTDYLIRWWACLDFNWIGASASFVSSSIGFCLQLGNSLCYLGVLNESSLELSFRLWIVLLWAQVKEKLFCVSFQSSSLSSGALGFQKHRSFVASKMCFRRSLVWVRNILIQFLERYPYVDL